MWTEPIRGHCADEQLDSQSSYVSIGTCLDQAMSQFGLFSLSPLLNEASQRLGTATPKKWRTSIGRSIEEAHERV